jgi:putative membrane protein
MRLVVCVDRDDDLGRKAGVEGPVVGRQAVAEAAVRLGTADPEDADTNAMFAAIRLLDEIRNSGDEAEVVVLTGSPKVGLLSDRRIAEEFDSVLKNMTVSGAHLVSDGAEDEYIFPILASRVRIDGVHRVFIRQNASLESTYYTLVRALKDPKLRAKTVLPFALVLLGLGIAAIGGLFLYGTITLAVLLGVYLIFWTFDIDEAIIDTIRSASSDIRTGAVAFGFGLFAAALIGAGFLVGFNQYVAPANASPIDRLLIFVQAGLIWWLFGGEVWESGRAIRQFFARNRLPRSFGVASLSIVGLGFVSYGIVFLVEFLANSIPPSLLPFLGTLPLIATFIVVGLGLVVLSAVLSQYLKSHGATTEEKSGEPAGLESG